MTQEMQTIIAKIETLIGQPFRQSPKPSSELIQDAIAKLKKLKENNSSEKTP